MIKRLVRALLPDRVLGRLRSAKIRHMVARYPRRVVQHRYGGLELRLELRDPLAEGWYDKDWPSPPEMELLKRRGLRPGGRVFDLGAHQGVVALMLADAVGPTGQVIAVEASEHNFAAACRNRELNSSLAPRLHLVHAAVAETPGELMFNEGLNGQVEDGSGQWGRVQVPALTIDDLTEKFGPPDVLYLDLEGYECAALRGADRTLARCPDCFIEVHVGHGLEKFGGSVDQILAYFPSSSYELKAATEDDQMFVPLRRGEPLTNSRFFLLALVRD